MTTLPNPGVILVAWHRGESPDEFSASPEQTMREVLRERSLAFGSEDDLASEWKRLFVGEQITEITAQGISGITRHVAELIKNQQVEFMALADAVANVTVTVRSGFLTNHLVDESDFFVPEIPELDRSFASNAPFIPLYSKTDRFVPSKTLTDLWIASVKSFAKDALSTEPAVPDEADVQKEFTKLLTGLFGTIGQQLRYEGSSDTNITQGGAFTPSFEVEISDRLLILPSRAARFLSLLRDELITAIRAGAVFEGAWGRVVLNGFAELQYALVPRNRNKKSEFVPAKRVE